MLSVKGYLVLLAIAGRANLLWALDILKDEFEPLDPVLRSDVGLMSVNVPPVFLREHFWLHSIAIDMPCIDDVVNPNVLSMTNDMSYSTYSIKYMVKRIQIDHLNPKSKERILGPLQALNQTYAIFLSHLKNVRKRYFDVIRDPMSLWGLLPKERCNENTKSDITQDEENFPSNHLARQKREITTGLNTNKQTGINIEGSGPTLILNHERPQSDVGKGTSPTKLIEQPPNGPPQEKNEANDNSQQVLEGQIFERVANAGDDTASKTRGNCEVNYQGQIQYLSCVISQSKPEQVCFSKYLICRNSHSRSKRGLVDFIGDIHNKLFGVATDAQLDKLHELLKDVENSTFRNSDEIKLLRNSTMSMSNHIMTTMTDLTKDIYGQLESLTNSIHTWAIGMEKDIRRAGSSNKKVHLTMAVSVSTITLNSYIHILISMARALSGMKNYYSTLTKLASLKAFPALFASNAYLDGLWDTLAEVLPSHLSMPITRPKLEVMQNNVYQIYTTQNHMMVLIRIPIILKPEQLTFWEPRTVPVVRGEVAYQVDIAKDILILNRKRREWASISHTDYVLCQLKKDKICEQLLIWSVVDYPNCHLSIHRIVETKKNFCVVREYKINEYRMPYAVPSGKRTWLISSKNSQTAGILKCTSSKGLPARISIIILPSLGLLQVPKHCMLEMGPLRIHSPMMEIGHSAMDVSEVLENVVYSKDIDIVSNLTIDVPFLHNIQNPKFVAPDVSTHTLFTDRLIDINNLNRKMMEKGKLFDNDISRLKYTIRESEKPYNTSLSGLSSYFSRFSIISLLVPIPSLFNTIVVLWLFFLTWRLL